MMDHWIKWISFLSKLVNCRNLSVIMFFFDISRVQLHVPTHEPKPHVFSVGHHRLLVDPVVLPTCQPCLGWLSYLATAVWSQKTHWFWIWPCSVGSFASSSANGQEAQWCPHAGFYGRVPENGVTAKERRTGFVLTLSCRLSSSNKAIICGWCIWNEMNLFHPLAGQQKVKFSMFLMVSIMFRENRYFFNMGLALGRSKYSEIKGPVEVGSVRYASHTPTELSFCCGMKICMTVNSVKQGQAKNLRTCSLTYLLVMAICKLLFIPCVSCLCLRQRGILFLKVFHSPYAPFMEYCIYQHCWSLTWSNKLTFLHFCFVAQPPAS